MRNGIPICEFFSDPCPYSYWDPHMHTAIPVCELTHIGIQDLISRMRTTSLCIRGVNEKSPYAYRDAQIPVCIRGLVSIRSPYAYGDLRIPVCIRGLILIPVCIRGLHVNNPRMHMGIFMRSPYAYGDQANPHMHTGISIELRVPQARADEGARVRAWCTAAQHIRRR